MLIRFQRTELVRARPERMFGVLTNYAAYTRINHFVKSVRVLRHDAQGAIVVADRTTPIERHMQFEDTYASRPLLQFERRYTNNPTACSTWTVEPAFGGRCYFTVMAQLTMPGPLGLLLRPVLWRLFNVLNFAPFIAAAEGWRGEFIPAC
jgi:hypothetical protein